VSIKYAVAAFILDALKASIESCKIFPLLKKSKGVNPKIIKSAITMSLGELSLILNAVSP
jgi:hypothetical protein